LCATIAIIGAPGETLPAEMPVDRSSLRSRHSKRGRSFRLAELRVFMGLPLGVCPDWGAHHPRPPNGVWMAASLAWVGGSRRGVSAPRRAVATGVPSQRPRLYLSRHPEA